MSAPLRFAFVLHIHQPVGNFDFVFEQHARDVYTPFLDFLDERELWPVALHVSGPLLEWLRDHDDSLHDRLGRLASDGKAELLSAGWYEPILASLDGPDRATQLGWMREELESRFGVTPRGAWLTERVWIPELASDLARAGIEYTLVDDHLVRRAGATDGQLGRPLRASHDGHSVELFAIDEGMRYLIPFKPADQVAADFRKRHAAGDPLALFADDGEKFGGWPRTREWLYDRGWLEAFGGEMDSLREEGVIRLVTPAQALDELDGPRPTFDLPVGSYPEMDEWAGGPWTNFLDRYEEAGRLHSWVSSLSAACRDAGDPPGVRRAIGRAQCNDAYWHGVFGGLYMKHLREGVRGWMAQAEATLRSGEDLAWENVQERSGEEAHWVHSARISARVSGRAGGTLTELVWLDPQARADVTDTLTRRLEDYHEEAVAREAEAAVARVAASETVGVDGVGFVDDTDGSASIHDIEEGATLERLPPVDPSVRVLVRDRVLGREVDFESYREGTFSAAWEAPDVGLVSPGAVAAAPDDAHSMALEWVFPIEASVGVTKRIVVFEDRVVIEWSWDPAGFPDHARMSPEFSFACPVDLALEPEPEESWSYPIVTVSKCPDGFEEIEQGTSVTPRWDVALGRARAVVRPAVPAEP